MKTVVPDYYPDFRCKAEKCKHTCCAGWEIDIDEETYEYYKSLDGTLAKKLLRSVSTDGMPHFILEGEDERCPMLDKNGLCRLITEFGEQALCQICADHPRFRNYYSDRTEIGLGLCCEAAGGLILGKTDKVKLTVLSDRGKGETASDEDSRLFEMRSKMTEILQNRHFTVNERMAQVLSAFGTQDKRSLKQLAELFLSLERLDESWTGLLLRLCETDFGIQADPDDAAGQIFEQFAVYLVFRHTPYLKNRAALRSISGLYRVFESLCLMEAGKSGSLNLEKAVEIARLLSSEIEYSDENMKLLFEQAD